MRRSSPALLTSSNPSTSKLSASKFSTSGLLTLALCLLILSTLSFAEAPDRIAPIVPGQMVALVGSVPPKAKPQYDKGPIDPQFTFGSVTLQTSPSASQETELDQLMAEQQDPSSPHYHQWLTPAQYADRFGLSHNDIDKITTWLKAQGFTVTRVAGGRNSIVFSGTALQIENAFQTSIHNYNVEGGEHFANAAPLKIPAAWAGVVTGVRGLHSFRWKAMGRRRPPHKNYYDSTFDFDFLAPGDVATLYDINALYNLPTSIDGTGQKLAIIGETDIYLADINDFRTGFGLAPIPTSGANSCASNSTTGLLTSCTNATNLGYVLVGTDPGKTYACGDLTEADTDIEWSGATARNAQIIYVNAPAIWVNPPTCTEISGGGVVDALSYAIAPSPGAPPVAPVISMSYGGCELESAPFLEAELKQAVMEGVTVVNSSGDTASAACDGFTNTLTNNLAIGGPAVNYPASSQYVTGVGGSAIPFIDLPPNPPGIDSGTYWGTPNPNPTDGTSLLPGPPRVPEEAWNDPFETAAECVADPSTNFCVDNGFGSTTTALQVQESPGFGIGGGGGGASNCYTQNAEGQCTGGFPQPSYQNFSPAITGAPAGVRYVPDVSLVGSANYPGYIFCTELTEWGLTGSGSTCAPGGAAGITNTLALTIVEDGVEYYDPTIIGGTSVSTPIFAGMVVLLNQYLGNSAGMSNINPTLYSLAKTPSNDYFHQLKPGAGIDTGNNQVYCDSGQPSDQPAAYQCPTTPDGIGVIGFESSNADATTGYNLVTGLGSVDLYNLAVAWLATEPNFTLSDSPGSLTITTGGAAGTSTITVNDANGFTGSVTLAASGLPSGVTATFSTNPTTSTSTLSLTASSGATTGTATVTITGTSGSLTATTTIALTVNATPTFTLSASPSVLTPTPGATGVASTVTVNDLNGFTGSVTLVASGLPSGVTGVFVTNPTTTTSTLTLTAAASALPVTATVTITGTSGALVATTTIVVSINQNINVPGTLTPPAAANPGQSTSTTMSIATASGANFAYPVTFSASNLPTGATVSFSPAHISANATSPQPVTITVQTVGPFTGVASDARRANTRRAALGPKQRLWLPLGLPWPARSLIGVAGRGLPRATKSLDSAWPRFSLDFW